MTTSEHGVFTPEQRLARLETVVQELYQRLAVTVDWVGHLTEEVAAMRAVSTQPTPTKTLTLLSDD